MVADNLGNVVAELTKVINSVAASLEASNAQKDAPPRPSSPRKASTRAKRSTRVARPSPAGTVTDDTVRTAMTELGPATSTAIAAHINAAVGATVIDGRSIRGHARRVGATVEVRDGERLYRL